MKLSQAVRPGPSQYIAEECALQSLKERIELFQQPVIVTGEKSFAAFEKRYGHIDLPIYRYDGTSSDEDAYRLAEEIGKSDLIVAIGGGKVCDTAKLVAERLHCEYITIPTVLGNCACYTPVVAVYEPNHAFKRVGYVHRAPLCTIVDYSLLLHSPLEYLKGGITDTLAKWYEAIALVEHSQDELSTTVDMGLAAAKICRDALLQSTEGAMKAMKEGHINHDFKRVTDTIYAVAGSVGGFAGEYGRMAGAHAIHNALAVVHECDAVLHGIKVGYGILIQLIVEGKDKQASELINYYRDNEFAYSKKTLGVSKDFEKKKDALAKYAVSEQESFCLIKKDLTAGEVLAAMEQLEELAKIEK